MKKLLFFLFFLILLSVVNAERPMKNFEQTELSEQEQIQLINQVIKEKKLDWIAGETSMTKLSSEERKAMLIPINRGINKRNKNKLVFSKLKTQIKTYPSTFDWRDNKGNWITPVKHQSSCGSCWAFNILGVVESRIKIALNNSDYDIDLSEQDLVSCSGEGDCSGAEIQSEADIFNYMKITGTVRESCFPYTATNNNCENKCSAWQSEMIKVLDYSVLPPSPSDIKQAIKDYGPVTVYMAVSLDFNNYISGVYSNSGEDFEGYHAIYIVGYNDTGHYWICKNSWGTGWGEKGFFRIDYSENVLDYAEWDENISDFRTFFLDSSYAVTSTDIDMDNVGDEIDNCPEISNPLQIDLDSNSIGDVCDCMPEWIQSDYNCSINNTGLINYIDSNNCNKSFGLPSNNGTKGSCDYCQENITFFYTNFSECMLTDIQTRIKYFVDLNFDFCCALTGLESDCNIIGYENITENQTCDFCVPDWNCTNFGNCQNDDRSYCSNVIDTNSCYVQTNLTTDLYQGNYTEFGTQNCDYCMPNWTCSEHTCSINDTGYCSNAIDNNSCYAQTSLVADLYNGTFKEFSTQSCDYCIPDWNEVLTECLFDESKTGFFVDDNNCHNLTGLGSDLDGKPENITYSFVCDFNKDGIIGNISDVNTTSNLTLVINSSFVKFEENNKTILEFDFNFSQGILNFAEISIEQQNINFSFIKIRGINLTPPNKTKTVYLNKLIESTGVCIKDSEIMEITSSCAGNNEKWVKCPGINGQYSCEVLNESKYKISGLSHSVVKEQKTYCGDDICNGEESCNSCSIDCGFCQPLTVSSGGGGGGGGSRIRINKTPLVYPVAKVFLPDFGITAGQEIIAPEKSEQIFKGDINETLDVLLEEGEIISFDINKETHSLKINKINTESMTFTISSNPIIDTLRISEIKKYDLNGNGLNDISIFLKEIKNGKADLIIEKLAEKKENSPTGAVTGTIQKSNLLYFLILTGVIFFILGLYFWRKKKVSF